jgi:hypothetical protein
MGFGIDIIRSAIFGFFEAVGLGGYPEIAGYMASAVFWIVVATIASWSLIVAIRYFPTKPSPRSFNYDFMWPEIRPGDVAFMLVALIFGGITIAGLGFILTLVAVYLVQVLGIFLLRSSGEPWFVPVGLTMAWLLYVLRERLLPLYAMLEIVIGIAAVTASVRTGSTADRVPHLIAVFGGIYVIVRGLDNLNKGLPALQAALPYRVAIRLGQAWELIFKFRLPPHREETVAVGDNTE